MKEPKNETPRQCEEAVLQLFHNRLGLRDITAKDIDAVHRLGKRTETNKTRGIIVRFVSRKTREAVIGNRRKLKKEPGQTSNAIVIAEDLTKDNYILYSKARTAEATENCWTKMGKVFVKTKAGDVKQIKTFADIEGPRPQAVASKSQSPQNRAQMQSTNLNHFQSTPQSRKQTSTHDADSQQPRRQTERNQRYQTRPWGRRIDTPRRQVGGRFHGPHFGGHLRGQRQAAVQQRVGDSYANDWTTDDDEGYSPLRK